MKILKANVVAALNVKNFSRQDMSLLKKYAETTASDYCAGCASICESAVKGSIPINDVLRYLMYYHRYGEYNQARSLFREIPVDIRKRIANIDYTLAEGRCPQRMPIARLMKEATMGFS